MRIIDRIGQKYGRLTVVARTPSPDGNAKWECQCECGRKAYAYGGDLQRGKVVSCGCQQAERRFTHGMAHDPVYRVWIEMRARCSNPNHASWRNYGGRGIRVSDEWGESFETFLRDMGPRPKGYQIERVDNNRGYSKENCVWATVRQQRNNQRNNRILEVNGVRRTFAEWARLSGLPWTTIRSRIERYGWDVESAVTLPQQAGRSLSRTKEQTP